MVGIWLWGTAAAGDVHLRIVTADGDVDQELSWPSMETLSKKVGPFEGKKLVQQWTITAQPSVFDPLGATYGMEITACVAWAKSGHNDKHCEKYELAAGSSPAVLVTRAIKAKHGVKLGWELSAWYTGATPQVGLPPEATSGE